MGNFWKVDSSKVEGLGSGRAFVLTASAQAMTQCQHHFQDPSKRKHTWYKISLWNHYVEKLIFNQKINWELNH